MEEDFEILADIINEKEEIKPIELGGGLIAYRKYIWAIKFLEEKALKLETYKQEVVKDIDKAIESKKSAIKHLKGEIERAMLADSAVDSTPSGGKNLALPDIATVSISKLKDKVVINDPETVLDELGDEFKKVKISLDATKAKKHILETGQTPDGASKKQERAISFRFKK